MQCCDPLNANLLLSRDSQGAWPWAQETLRKHANDVREPSYSEEEMEFANTKDELWNAAQRQALQEGKMHSFLRMYWAKKILEWHAAGPEKALQLGFRLSGRYSLDGTDPNGYLACKETITMPPKPSTDDFLKWLDRINANRVENCGKSVADYSFSACRIRRMSGKNEFRTVRGKNMNDISGGPGSQRGCVVYWMNRDQRIHDNWALLFAQRIALKFSVTLHVCFNLVSSPALRTRRHANFLLEGLVEVEKECKDLNIGFHLLPLPATKSNSAGKRSVDGDSECQGFDAEKMELIVDLLKRLDAGVVVTDFSPLRDDLQGVQFVSGRLPQDTPLYQVDAHNVVPVWVASEKLECGAWTIREKLNDKAKDLLTDFPPVICHPSPYESEAVDWKAIKESLVDVVDESVEPVTWAKGGCKAGLSQLFLFLHDRLHAYAKDHNDPTKNALSNLSPWLHFASA
ncbi:unnamed protein product [Taenia asiatica]|uniref:Photolyase/cryptochrome alpha/beta domain-containing protein n=1 Tax=Taenia asiatica TaxID=60517 RepID=A0A0R3WFZ9_TAEAS|nr:unnamed protein product [Taenia asiatica]